MTTAQIVIICIIVLCIMGVLLQLVKKGASIWTLPCMIFIGMFAIISVFLLGDIKQRENDSYTRGVQKGLDSNIQMKYVLITDSLYKKK